MRARGAGRAARGLGSGAPALLAALLTAAAAAAQVPAPAPPAPRGAPASVPDPSCATWAVVVRAGVTLYPLPSGFLRAGTDSVRAGGRPLARGGDYLLDRTRGVLRLLRVPVPGETLIVSACALASAPPLEFRSQAFRPVGAAADGAGFDTLAAIPLRARPVTSRVPSEAPLGTALTLAGSKTLAVEFGSNQDAFLRQSLDLTVSGALAPGVDVTGVLTDRSSALSATGATEELRSIDRLLLRVSAPNASAELGDIGVALERGPFARFERRLQGVSGTVRAGGAEAVAAAASAQGEYRRAEFFGVEGRQGPYALTGAGGTVSGIVAGSEVVTVDGERLARGESADYSIDYDRGEITFTNRRPISSASRVAVDYQFSLDRFRRNLALAATSWKRGGWTLGAAVASEGDDRGRPIAGTLDASDQRVLALAGDSAARAVGGGVAAGGGDYDLVQGPGAPYYAFAGPDSGDYTVRFVFAGAGAGDYLDSARVAGRTAYRFAGAGAGTHVIGRSLPLPSSHQLASAGAAFAAGGLTVALDGAVSRRDRNTYSTLDDGDNTGGAFEARVGLAGRGEGTGGAAAGLAARVRSVESRFQPFGRLESAFGAEGWGLPAGADFDRQRLAELSGFARRGAAGELRAAIAGLETPDDYRATRYTLGWTRTGSLGARFGWDRSDGRQRGRVFADGGRDLRTGELTLRTPWLEPAVRGLWDERRSPSDSALAAARSREVAAELRSGAATRWRALAGASLRREALAAGGALEDRTEARTARGRLESPVAAPLSAAIEAQRREQKTLAGGARVRTDLASMLLRARDPGHGLQGQFGVEVTSEGQSVRERVLRFVGAGQGAYDSLGNLVGNGSWDLVLETRPELERVGRAASSGRATWQFGSGETWRGSRVEGVFESEARRRGGLVAADLAMPPGRVLEDPGLVRAALTQRIEAELAPGSAAAATRLRLERRVSADRGFANFAQTRDDRAANLRWRGRPAPAWTAEVETRWVRQRATQAFTGATPFARSLEEAGAATQLAFSPGARFRGVAALDFSLSRPEGADARTRIVRAGPDLGLSVGRHGRLDLSARRSFVSGPPPVALVPGIEPAGPPRWEATLRADHRAFESTTISLTWSLVERTGRPVEQTGRAEVRAFF